MSNLWDCAYARSIDMRRDPVQPGRTTAWVTCGVNLLAREPSTTLASFTARVDVANGIAVQQPYTHWMYPNMDMTVHPCPRPEGDWTGLDTTVSFGVAGHGLTSAVLHDTFAPVGHLQQILTVRPQTGRNQ